MFLQSRTLVEGSHHWSELAGRIGLSANGNSSVLPNWESCTWPNCSSLKSRVSFARNGSQFDGTDAWYLRIGWSSWLIGQFGKYHNTLSLSPQILHRHCFQFLLGLTIIPRENKNNACFCKFWRDKQRVLWYFPNWPILIDSKNRPCVFLGAVGFLLSQSSTYDNANPLPSPPFPLLNVTFDTTLSSLSSLKCVRHFELKCMCDSFQLPIAVIAVLSGFDTSKRLIDHFPFYWSESLVCMQP